MKKIYSKEHTSSFIKGINRLTGISESKLKKYAAENNLFNVLEHPRTIEPNNQQLEKIYILNEFISIYGLLKIQENENNLSFTSPKIAGEYFTALLGGVKDREKFMVAFLDNGHNIIETKTLSEGCVSEAVVYPREILKAALDCDCTAILLAHNHPGKSMKPSSQDIAMTQRIVSIFSPLQISVLDHIIVAGNKYYSMKEAGTFPQAHPDIYSNTTISPDDHKNVKENEIEFGTEIYHDNNVNDDYFSDQEDEDQLEI